MPLEVEIIPVSDADRSRQFYERLGWGRDAACSDRPGPSTRPWTT
jgi:catechol 2,3-dioxygenase-like lactoylglutathione lyase family enzyme